MPAVQELIRFAISAGLTMLILAIGLQAGVDDVLYVLRRPSLLLRSLVPIVIIVPLFAAAMLLQVALTHEVAVAIMLMAISPLPPFVPGKQLKLGGSRSYVFGLLLAVSLCSIVTVPLSLAILSRALSLPVALSPAAVAQMVFASILLPMGLGMLVHRLWPDGAVRLAPWVSRLATLSLLVGVVPVVIAVWPAMLQLVGNGSLLAMVAVVVVGMLAGHWLGGPQAQDRVVLAAAASARHPGIAMLVAGTIHAAPGVKAGILLFALVGVLTTIPYQLWFKHRYSSQVPRERDSA